MKRLLMLALIAAILVIPICALPAKSAVVVDSSKLLSMVAPAGWTENKSGFMGAKLILLGPRHDDFTTNINLAQEKVGNLSLAKYQKIGEANAPKMVHKYKFVSRRNVKLGGVPAIEWVYTMALGDTGRMLKVKSLCAIRKGTAHTLTYTSLTPYYSKHIKDFHSAAATVKWLK